jgi:hypothetical protein
VPSCLESSIACLQQCRHAPQDMHSTCNERVQPLVYFCKHACRQSDTALLPCCGRQRCLCHRNTPVAHTLVQYSTEKNESMGRTHITR